MIEKLKEKALYAHTERPLTPEFQKMIADRGTLAKLLKESDIILNIQHNAAQAWQWWKEGRKPVADIIDSLVGPARKNVTMFDYGSANGFFLRSLQEWSAHHIEPFGYDAQSSRVRAARKLFPGKEKHFAINKKELEVLPKTYDFVYWNVWDSLRFEAQRDYQLLDEQLARLAPSGKLILGLYDHKKEDRDAKIALLRAHGLTPEGIRETERGTEAFVWFAASQRERLKPYL